METKREGKNPEEYGTLTDEKNKAYFLPEIEEGIKMAKAEREKQIEEQKKWIKITKK